MGGGLKKDIPLFGWFTFAPYDKSASAHSPAPTLAAMASGVVPSLAGWFTIAFLSSSRLTMLERPFCAATYSGVAPVSAGKA